MLDLLEFISISIKKKSILKNDIGFTYNMYH